MSLGLIARRHAAVKARIISLTRELDTWLKLTEDDKHGLGRHQSQVRRLDTTLRSLLDPLQRTVLDTPAILASPPDTGATTCPCATPGPPPPA